MKLELEFIERRRMPWFGLTFFIAAAACVVLAGVEWAELRAVDRHDGDRIAFLQKQLQARQREAQVRQSVRDSGSTQRIKDGQAIAAELSYSWNRVFSPIEQTDRHGVAILLFSHDQAGGNTQLSVEALSTKALIDFVDSLNEGAEAEDGSHWYLASYQSQPQNNPQTVKGMIQNLPSRL